MDTVHALASQDTSVGFCSTRGGRCLTDTQRPANRQQSSAWSQTSRQVNEGWATPGLPLSPQPTLAARPPSSMGAPVQPAQPSPAVIPSSTERATS